MTFASRGFALLVLALALAAAGCSSNNKGKIVGKWETGGGKLVFEFTDDGRFIASGVVSATGNYSLGSGDWVFLRNISPPLKNNQTKSKDKIVINGDTMTIDSEKGDKLTFNRMK